MIVFISLELRELVKMHGDGEQGNEDPLSYDEVLIVKVRTCITDVRLTKISVVCYSHCIDNP